MNKYSFLLLMMALVLSLIVNTHQYLLLNPHNCYKDYNKSQAAPNDNQNVIKKIILPANLPAYAVLQNLDYSGLYPGRIVIGIENTDEIGYFFLPASYETLGISDEMPLEMEEQPAGGRSITIEEQSASPTIYVYDNSIYAYFDKSRIELIKPSSLKSFACANGALVGVSASLTWQEFCNAISLLNQFGVSKITFPTSIDTPVTVVGTVQKLTRAKID